jgi:hypothetical protein
MQSQSIRLLRLAVFGPARVARSQRAGRDHGTARSPLRLVKVLSQRGDGVVAGRLELACHQGQVADVGSRASSISVSGPVPGQHVTAQRRTQQELQD